MSEITTVEQALEAVKENGFALEHVPKEFKTPSVCLAALKCSGDSGNYAEDVLDYVPQNMREMIKDVERIENLPEDLPDEEICRIAVQALCTLEEIPEQYRTEFVCLEAIKQNGFALEYVPAPLKTLELCIKAIKQCKHAIIFVPESLKNEVINATK